MTQECNIAEIQLKYKPSPITDTIRGSKDIYNLLISKVYDADTIGYNESFKLLLLDNANQIIGYRTISEGGLSRMMVDIRMIFQVALIANATSIIISHNHPSGKKRPSGEDDTLTKQIQDACKVLFIRLLDHIIVTPENGYYSYCDEGRL